ncbi:MAG: D-aminopeptidase [Syntrophus sp. SKADARSKE-3]|nr:D-aminopeptidase [Syntrophus sp. SKADARSKE-3]
MLIIFLHESTMFIRYFHILSILIIIILIANCSNSNSPPASSERMQASLDANWTQYKQGHQIPDSDVRGTGIAVYITTPKGNYYASSGMDSSVNQNTRFRIASNTKTFTAAAIMLLYQKGKLDINHSITSLIPGKGIPYVPDTSDWAIWKKADITIKELLAHTAGVYDVDNDETLSSPCISQLYTGKKYTSCVLAKEPQHQFIPGELVGVDAATQLYYFNPGDVNFHYSDTGYTILAEIIERVSGMSYDQFIMQNLVNLNGLTSTIIPMWGWEQAIPPPFNPGYVYEDRVLTDTTASNMSVHIGEGNIISTPADIARWIRLLIRGEAGINSTLVEMMKTPTAGALAMGEPYGLGIGWKSGLGYGHTGATKGYLSLMMYDPDADVSTIVYFNIWDSANLLTDQSTLMTKAGRDARASVGY